MLPSFFCNPEHRLIVHGSNNNMIKKTLLMLQNSMDAEVLDMKNYDLEDISKKKNENPDLNMRCG